MHKLKYILAAVFCTLVSLSAWGAGDVCVTQISGRVALHEHEGDTLTHPADYVMVYAKEYSVGSLSDEEGAFSFVIKGESGKSVELELSRIGYSMVRIPVVLSGGDVDMGTIILEPQPLMLMAAYVSDEGKSPSEIILSKTWARSKEIREHPFDYRADIDYIMASHDIPIVAKAAPKILMGALKLFMGHEGYGPILNYTLKHDDCWASATMTRFVKGDRTLDCNQRLTDSSAPLPDDVRRNVLNALKYIDFFDVMYGEGNAWGEKFSQKHKFTLTGTYEWGDELVDVLSHTDRHGRSTAVLHIVEGSWMILKIQLITKEGEVFRCESRDVGNGIFMPVALVLKPSVTMIRHEQIPSLIKSIESDKNIPKKSKARMIKVLSECEGDFNPYISVAGNVKYTL